MNKSLKIPYYNENDSFDGAAVAEILDKDSKVNATALLYHTEDAVYIRMETEKEENSNLEFLFVPYPLKDKRCFNFVFTPSGEFSIKFDGAEKNCDLAPFKLKNTVKEENGAKKWQAEAKIPYKFLRQITGNEIPFSDGQEMYANFCLCGDSFAVWNGTNSENTGSIYISYETKEKPEFSIRVNLTKYENSIKEFEAKPLEKGKILCYGSSTFTRWKKEKWGNQNIEDVILGKDGSKVMLNHGFGGCTAEELLYYYPRAVRPYEPKALFICIGANDRAFGYSNKEIMAYITKVFDYARADFKDIKFALCDNRPLYKGVGNAPAYYKRLYDFNDMCKQYCLEHSDCILVEHSSSPMFFDDGFKGDYSKVRKDIFIEDKVHLTPEGYIQYADFVREQIKELL